MSEDDFVRWNNGEPVSAKPIDDVPPQFKRWVADNADKIQSSKSLPYFVRDNRAVVNDIIGKPVVTKRDTAIGSNPAAMVDTKNNDNSANFNKQIEEYLGIKPKQVSNEQLAFADISGGIVPLAYNSFRKALQVYYNVSANKEKTAILKSIIANENFKKLNYHSTKENSIFGINMQSFDKALSEKEMPANLAMAKKFVKNKYDVYLLSNPKTITSADFIVSKKGKIFYIEGKKSTGGGAFITRIKDGAKQSDRVAVDLIDYGNTNKLSSDIKSAFVDEANLKELYLFKGGRLIKIERDVALSNNFYKWFAKQWVKNK